ncbi:hypothetical protein SELMODRAFT_431485 [Selaginella moellendorffii]|uniref:Protein kinase domain-containing protein n=1 Tax=Selaginella moellendorffii TaxID=88036 RepID=D8TCT6_SELML|nr:hypothetical protein SELMODRAFT_431485 [Selaginella moellendorffii]
MAALATGWYTQDRSLCSKNIQVLAPNGRTAVARMVAECYSPGACLRDHSFTEPCAPNAVAANEQVWRQLGYDPGIGILRNITWNVIDSNLPQSIRSKKNYQGVISGVASAVAGVVLSVVIFVATRKWRRSRRRRMEKQALIEGMRLDEILPHQFSYHDLKMATRNFDPELTLGAGGFGSVFKGELADGSLVAVKKMDVEIQGSSKGHSQFKAEVMSIGSIHHFNLVKLRGFCIQGPAALLVYEFIPNGSLDKWIFIKNDDDKVPSSILLFLLILLTTALPGRNRAEHVSQCNVVELIDDKLLDNDLDSTSSGLELKDVERYVKIGLWCIQLEAAIRPSMRNVLDMLEASGNEEAYRRQYTFQRIKGLRLHHHQPHKI